ncbi:MAG TPA: ribonuclease P protein component [Candidatus Levybacteria bacterium]|nr:ribonuclease P protein component [Candidatus Levybacteria bacterium]
MFKKIQRFSFKSGAPKQKIITPSFVFRYQKSETPTYAVIAGKKVSKKAVLRNKGKRMVREAIINACKNLQNSYTIVVILRLPFQEYKKSAIIDEVEQVVARLNK